MSKEIKKEINKNISSLSEDFSKKDLLPIISQIVDGLKMEKLDSMFCFGIYQLLISKMEDIVELSDVYEQLDKVFLELYISVFCGCKKPDSKIIDMMKDIESGLV